jgi:hypothetical protein
MIKPAPTNTPVRLRGETLRAKSDPTVAELMVRRRLEVPEENPNTYDLAAIESGLVNVPAFRHLLARKLDNATLCGSIEYRAPDNVIFQITNYMSGSRGVAFPEGNHPANGTKTELRWCDWIAWSLSNSKQIPFFNPFASIEQRDEAIASARNLLEQR